MKYTKKVHINFTIETPEEVNMLRAGLLTLKQVLNRRAQDSLVTDPAERIRLSLPITRSHENQVNICGIIVPTDTQTRIDEWLTALK